MATKLGTAFVDIQPDFSQFDRLVQRKLAGSLKGAGEQAGEDFSKGFDEQASGVLIPIDRAVRNTTKNTDGLGAAARKAARGLKRAGADGSDAMGSTGKAANVAKAAVAEVAKAVGDIPTPDLPPINLDQSGRIDLKIAGAEGSIQLLEAHIKELTGKPQSAEIDVKIAKAVAQLETVQALRDKLVAQKAEINVEVDPVAFRATMAAVNKLRDAGKIPSVVPTPAGPALADLNARINARQAANPFAKDGAASFDASRKAAEGLGQAVDGVAAKVNALSSSSGIDLKIDAVDAQIAVLQAKLAKLAKESPTLEVHAKTLAAQVQLDALERKKEQLAATKATITVDTDRSVLGFLSAFASKSKELATSLGGSGLGGATTRVALGFLSFNAGLTPLIGLIGALALAVGVALVGAFAALASSLALAAAGLAALGAAFAATLGPAVTLAVAVGARLAKIFEALKAQDTAADEIGRKSAAGSAAATAAQAQQAGAARALTEANRQLGLATSSAYREMADAAERASDSIRSVEGAQLSLESAKLSTDRAKLALEQFRQEAGASGQAFGAIFDKFTDVAVDTSGLKNAIVAANEKAGGGLDQSQQLELRQKILDVRDARFREKEATDGVSDAMREATRAQQDNNKFKRDGIKASESYRGALRAVEAATLAVAAAQSANDGTASVAAEKASQLTGRLSKTELAFLGTLKQVRKELRGAFGPATDAVLGGMNRALARTPLLVNPLRGAFRRLGAAVGQATDQFSADLVKPETVGLFKKFTDGAARLAGPITNDLSLLLDIFLRIANAALPHLVDGVKRVGDHLFRWSEATKDTRKLDKTISGLVGHTKTWLGVFGSLGGVVLAFFGVAAPEGEGLAKNIKELADRTAVWLRSTEGRRETQEFLRSAVEFTKDFVAFLGRLIEVTTRFSRIAIRVFAGVIEKMGGAKNATDALVFALGTLAALKFAKGVVTGIRSVAVALRGAKKASDLLTASWNTGVLAAARHKAAMLASRATTILWTAATKAARGMQLLLNLALRLNPIGLVVTAIAALAAGLIYAYKKSETFRRIVDGAFAGIKRAARESIQFILARFDDLLGGFSSIATGMSHIPFIGDKFKGAADKIDHAREKLRGFAKSLDDVAKIKDLKIKVDVELTTDMRRLLRNIDNPSTSKLSKTPPVRLHRASGGIIPGTGNLDNVPTFTTPGEYVTRKIIVQRFGPTVFADINAGRLDPRVGYGPDERPTTKRVRPVKGRRFATGGLVGATATAGAQTTVHASFPITVPGGGPPDPVALGVMSSRVIENRFGGDVGQEV